MKALLIHLNIFVFLTTLSYGQQEQLESWFGKPVLNTDEILVTSKFIENLSKADIIFEGEVIGFKDYREKGEIFRSYFVTVTNRIKGGDTITDVVDLVTEGIHFDFCDGTGVDVDDIPNVISYNENGLNQKGLFFGKQIDSGDYSSGDKSPYTLHLASGQHKAVIYSRTYYSRLAGYGMGIQLTNISALYKFLKNYYCINSPILDAFTHETDKVEVESFKRILELSLIYPSNY